MPKTLRTQLRKRCYWSRLADGAAGFTVCMWDVREIAGEKLAVAPDGSDRVVVGYLDPAAADAVTAIMAERRLTGWRVGREIDATGGAEGLEVRVGDARYTGLVVGAGGRFQRENLTVAIAAAQRFLGRPLAPDGVREAAATVRVPGRLEVFEGAPRIVIDGAHNPAGMQALAASLEDVFRACGRWRSSRCSATRTWRRCWH